MIGSRAICLLKNISRSPTTQSIQKRWMSNNSEDLWQYRGYPNPPKWAVVGAHCTAVVAYWWFYWNLWHQWPHLVGIYCGEFLPNPRKFTNEELGIPPDDVD